MRYLLFILPFLGLTLASAADKPNIILILADDLGIGDCSIYNPESKIQTPAIDSLAKDGMRFTDAHAAGGICVPSRYGLMTGEYACRTWDQYPARSPNLKDPKKLTIASLLQSNGYDTAMMGKWHLSFLIDNQNPGKIKHSPIEFGFDSFFGMNQSLDTQPYYYAEDDRVIAAPTEKINGQIGDPNKVANTTIQGPMWREGMAAPDFDHAACLPLFNDKAIDYLESREPNGDPFFLYLAYAAPHAPWLPDSEFRGKSGAGDYGDFVMQVDHSVQAILDTLEAKGLTETTMVIFTSDNGALWLPGDIERYGHRASGIYKGMKGALHEGGHRTPFLVRWPERIAAGSTSDQFVNFTDVMETFADLVGTELPGGAGKDSFSFLHALLGKAATKPVRTESIHENYGGYTLAYRQGDWKLCLPNKTYEIANQSVTPGKIIDITKMELYDLKNDPAETTNLVGEHPEKAEQLFESLIQNIEAGQSKKTPQ